MNKKDGMLITHTSFVFPFSAVCEVECMSPLGTSLCISVIFRENYLIAKKIKDIQWTQDQSHIFIVINQK